MKIVKLKNWRPFGRREKSVEPDFSRLPRHIAIILDGNGRWAASRGLPRTAGHRAGAENLRKIATLCRDIGIKYLTVYAFSTENWSRPQTEVSTLMSLFKEYLNEVIEDATKNNGVLKVIGDVSPLQEELKELIREAERVTAAHTGLQMNICINYGGRADIVHAASALARMCKDGELQPEEITPELLSENLYTAGIPDPDLLIRPSGEYRISNFLLWQSAYSEFYYTPVLWPDFDQAEFYRAIVSFQKRDRRYGGLGAQAQK